MHKMSSSWTIAYGATEVLEYLSSFPNATIFLDVDDTLILPVSETLRTPPWNTLIDEIKKNSSLYPHYEDLISHWRLQRRVMLVDAHWPQVFNLLKMKHAVYALSKIDSGAFGNIPSMEAWRYLELQSLGITFSDRSFGSADVQGPSFYRGIMLTGAQSKAQTLAYYIEHFNGQPWVLVDDRIEHLDDVAQWCEKHSIDFRGILFQGAQKHLGKADPLLAHFQKDYLLEHRVWLEDEEAHQKMTGQHPTS